jgi:voltage-gated potassium channel
VGKKTWNKQFESTTWIYILFFRCLRFSGFTLPNYGLDFRAQTLFHFSAKAKKINMGTISHWSVFRKFYLVAFALTFILIFGISGFILIEGWSFLDATYMMVITISTVGFGEVKPMTAEGRIFTIFLIMSTFGTFTYLISLVTTLIASGELGKNIKNYKILKIMSGLENHIIVCGLGRAGIQVAQDLLNSGCSVVAIEEKSSALSLNLEGLIIINGDATKDEVLLRAGLKNAKAIITCLPNDTDNLFIVLSSKACTNDIQIITRASQKSTVEKMKIAGAHHVIMPDSIGGSHMAALISSPEVIEFLDQIKVESNSSSNIESISFDELPQQYKGKSLEELNLKKLTGATDIGFRSKNGEFIVNPPDTIILEEKSSLLVLGNTEQIAHVNKIFNLPTNS